MKSQGILKRILSGNPAETFERFSLNSHPNVPISETVCRVIDSATQTLEQGHTSRSWDLPLDFMSAPYLLNPLSNFH